MLLMLLILFLSIFMPSFDWCQVGALNYTKQFEMSLDPGKRQIQININLKPFPPTEMVEFYFHLSHNGKCLRRVVFLCDKCTIFWQVEHDPTVCEKSKIYYNRNESTIRYEIDNQDVECGQYSGSLVSFDLHNWTIEGSVNRTVTNVCSQLRHLKISSTPRDCKTAAMNITFKPPISNTGHPILLYRVTIKSFDFHSNILSTVTSCKNCNNQLPLSLSHQPMFDRGQETIYVPIDDSRIAMATSYKVLIEYETGCVKCNNNITNITTVSKYSFPEKCKICKNNCRQVCVNVPYQSCKKSCFIFIWPCWESKCVTKYRKQCDIKCHKECRKM